MSLALSAERKPGPAIAPVIEIRGVLIVTRDLLYIRPLDGSVLLVWPTKELHILTDSYQTSVAICLAISERMEW